MSRIGKIARLPKAVREELNQRMEDGEEGKGLVAWLNGQAEVQSMLQTEFEGRTVNESNLTAWRQGGFEDWRRQQQSLNAAERLTEETGAIAETMAAGDRGRETGDRSGVASLTDRVSMMAALALGQEFMALRRMEDGDEKRRAVLKLVRGLVRLRKSDRECERGMREAAQAARAAEVHEDWAASRQAQANRDVWNGGGSEVRRKMTAVIAGMSDEEIAESLRRSGHLGTENGERRTEDGPAKQVWWTDEDQAFEEAEEAKEKAAAKAEPARTLNAERLTSNAQVTSSSVPPPEGGTTSTSLRTSASTSTNMTAGASAEELGSSTRPPEGGTTSTSTILPPEGGTQPSPGGYGGQATNDGRAGGGALI